jgi:hypothetical protein
MAEEKRYYVSDKSDTIIEYPDKIIHSPVRTIRDGDTTYIKAIPEFEIAHHRDVFRLHPDIAEPAIAAWKKARNDKKTVV